MRTDLNGFTQTVMASIFATAIIWIGGASAYAGDLPHAKKPLLPASGNDTIIFSSNRTGNSDIFTTDLNGNNLNNLTTNPAQDTVPSYTPDGNTVIFTSNRTGDEEIFSMAQDGTNPVNLTSNPGKRDWFPVISPTGTHIAYWAERTSGVGQQLNIMRIDGSAKLTLSDPNHSLYPEPHVFSKSGQLLAYADSYIGNPKIHIVNADGSNDHALTTDATNEIHPIFTCDNSHVVFNTLRDGNWEIYVSSVDGAGLTNLSNNTAGDYLAGLSSDCSKILFESDRSGNRDIFSMNFDGSGVMQLTHNPGEDYRPFYSPDDKKIGFISRPGNSGQYDLWVMNADGSNLHQVSTSATNGATCCPQYQFSADSNKLLFHSFLPGNNLEIFIVNADGSGLINISNDPANDGSESFKPATQRRGHGDNDDEEDEHHHDHQHNHPHGKHHDHHEEHD